jgi:hypothetical protein
MEEGHGAGKMFISWQSGSKEKQEGARARYTLHIHTCSDPLLQAGPTSYYLPLPAMPSHSKSIKRFIH